MFFIMFVPCFSTFFFHYCQLHSQRLFFSSTWLFSMVLYFFLPSLFSCLLSFSVALSIFQQYVFPWDTHPSIFKMIIYCLLNWLMHHCILKLYSFHSSSSTFQHTSTNTFFALAKPCSHNMISKHTTELPWRFRNFSRIWKQNFANNVATCYNFFVASIDELRVI